MSKVTIRGPKEDIDEVVLKLEALKKFVADFPVEIRIFGKKYVFDNEPEIFDLQTILKQQK